MAILALAVAGAAAGAGIGSAFGAAALGASLGFTVGSILGQMLFGGGKKIVSQQLADTQLQNASYGTPIPIVGGRYRLAGTVIWEGPLTEQDTQQTSGGKGGGGQTTVTSRNFFISFAVGICEGPIYGFVQLYANGKLIYDPQGLGSQYAGIPNPPENLSSSMAGYVSTFLGDESQTASAVIESVLGAGNVPAYRGLAYVVFNQLPLANFGNAIPAIHAVVDQNMGDGVIAMMGGLVEYLSMLMGFRLLMLVAAIFYLLAMLFDVRMRRPAAA